MKALVWPVATVAPPGFCNRGGSEVWVYRGSRVRSPPVPVVLSVYQRASLLDGLAMYLSCDTKKFHHNESTYYIIFGRPPIWGGGKLCFPPFPLWRRHCVATYGCEICTLRKNEEARLDASEMKGLRKILQVSWTAKKTNECVLNRQSKEASILWSHHEETRELHGERDNAMNNARCTQARKATHGLDGQHQDMDRTLHGRVNQNDRVQG